ncbi:MAG: efflux RND transporter periplasmic adaptor subunit [Desulfuromonadaceae bacterium]|nr:efflux RND transporter periplasmic adaptor subunit [Desulfuromonadaceae bacterium]
MNTEQKKSRMALKIILPILILLLGIGAFVGIGKLKKPPQRQISQQLGILVDVIELQAAPHQVTVHATGTVQTEQEIALVPEVSGKVNWISPRLVGGGMFKNGEILLKIEQSDYLLTVEKARADIARAQVALKTEQERARVARQEWQRVALPDNSEPGPLVTREIQLQQEQANLAAAQANLQLASLNLQRTELKAPFNGRIRREQVDLGQYLRAGTSIGSFAGTDRAEIHIPLPTQELKWLTIPMAGSTRSGSTAYIDLPGNRQTRWQGRIVRSLGEIDPGSHMATVIVVVDDPYQLAGSSGLPDLATGLFVDIELLGNRLDSIISIPRDALRNNQQVWIADDKNRLRLRPVDILRREQRQLLISKGVSSGERLIMTTLSPAAEGMLLRPVLQERRL